MIRFLADENLPLASVQRLRDEGYDVVSMADILIAATASIHGLVLVTEHVTHFQRMPG
jgi:predicted nucleic acid-binding protein